MEEVWKRIAGHLSCALSEIEHLHGLDSKWIRDLHEQIAKAREKLQPIIKDQPPR